MSAKDAFNYIIPSFTLLWSLIFFFLLETELNRDLELVNTLIIPIIVGVIGILGARESKDQKENIFRVFIGLCIITLGFVAFVMAKPLTST